MRPINSYRKSYNPADEQLQQNPTTNERLGKTRAGNQKGKSNKISNDINRHHSTHAKPSAFSKAADPRGSHQVRERNRRKSKAKNNQTISRRAVKGRKLTAPTSPATQEMRLTGSLFTTAAAMQTLEAATVAQPRREQSAALTAYSMFWARSSAE